jgi:GMP synthase (glutamine-hydrolysing)
MFNRTISLNKRLKYPILDSYRKKVIQTLNTPTTLKYLIIDSYTTKGRQDLVNHNASTAGILYKKTINECTPNNFKVECDIIYPADTNCIIPSESELDQYDGITWTGCSLSVINNDKIVDKQIDLMQRCFNTSSVMFGSCWALQVAVTALGGRCIVNPNGRETYISRKILLNEFGKSHPMYHNKPHVFDSWTSHEDIVVSMPPNSSKVNWQILSGNNMTSIQSASLQYKNAVFWAVQYHPEYNIYEMARLLSARIEKLVRLGMFSKDSDVEYFINCLDTLHKDNNRIDLRFLLGIDNDILDSNIKNCEMTNYINHLVIPRKLRNGKLH